MASVSKAPTQDTLANWTKYDAPSPGAWPTRAPRTRARRQTRRKSRLGYHGRQTLESVSLRINLQMSELGADVGLAQSFESERDEGPKARQRSGTDCDREDGDEASSYVSEYVANRERGQLKHRSHTELRSSRAPRVEGSVAKSGAAAHREAPGGGRPLRLSSVAPR